MVYDSGRGDATGDPSESDDDEEINPKRRREYRYAENESSDNNSESSEDDEDLGLDEAPSLETERKNKTKLKNRLVGKEHDDANEVVCTSENSGSSGEYDEDQRYDAEKAQRLLEAKVSERVKLEEKMKLLRDADLSSSSVANALCSILNTMESQIRSKYPKLRKMTPLVVSRFCKGEDCISNGKPHQRKKGFQRPPVMSKEIKEIFEALSDYCRRLQSEGLVDVYESDVHEITLFRESRKPQQSECRKWFLVRRNDEAATEGPYSLSDIRKLWDSVAHVPNYRVFCIECTRAGVESSSVWVPINSVLDSQ